MANALENKVFHTAYKNVLAQIMSKHGRKTDAQRKNGQRWYATYKYTVRKSVNKVQAKLKREKKKEAAAKVSAHIISNSYLFLFYWFFCKVCAAEQRVISRNSTESIAT